MSLSPRAAVIAAVIISIIIIIIVIIVIVSIIVIVIIIIIRNFGSGARAVQWDCIQSFAHRFAHRSPNNRDGRPTDATRSGQR